MITMVLYFLHKHISRIPMRMGRALRAVGNAGRRRVGPAARMLRGHADIQRLRTAVRAHDPSERSVGRKKRIRVLEGRYVDRSDGFPHHEG